MRGRVRGWDGGCVREWVERVGGLRGGVRGWDGGCVREWVGHRVCEREG